MVRTGRTEGEVGCEIRSVATVWDGEAAGMAGGLAKMRREDKILILADSKAAIARLAGRGKQGPGTCGKS